MSYMDRWALMQLHIRIVGEFSLHFSGVFLLQSKATETPNNKHPSLIEHFSFRLYSIVITTNRVSFIYLGYYSE